MNKKTVHQEAKIAKTDHLTIFDIQEYQKFQTKLLNDFGKRNIQFNSLMDIIIFQNSHIDQAASQKLSQINTNIQNEGTEFLNIINNFELQRKTNQQQIERLYEKLLKNVQDCKRLQDKEKKIKQKQLEQSNLLKEEQKKLNQIQTKSLNMKNKCQILLKNQQTICDLKIGVQSQIKKLEEECSESLALKKKLNNELQDLKGNIRVYCRIRPPNTNKNVLEITSQNTIKLNLSKQNVKQQIQKYDQSFAFDFIFNPNDSQKFLFAQTCQLVQNVVDGHNVCILAYGQTGSGKTYTLHGLEQQLHQKKDIQYKKNWESHRGLTSRSIEYIFNEINNSQNSKLQYRVFMSIIEIHKDNVIDLISNQDIEVDKHQETQIFCQQHTQGLLTKAKMHRKTSSTLCNIHSSRSHLIVVIRIVVKSQLQEECRESSLVLVDLAGSQRIKVSGVSGQALKQSTFINKSLSSLSNVINGLRKQLDHIPYRDSKLTLCLQNYLQRNGKMLMFVNVSPDEVDLQQTKNSLIFAENARETKLNNKRQ